MAGGLHYPKQEPIIIFSNVTLTTAFSGNLLAGILTKGYSEMTVYFTYTPGAGGSGNSFQVRHRGSPDGLNSVTPPTYYQSTISSITGGIETLVDGTFTYVGATAATAYSDYYFFPPAHILSEIAVKETIVGGSAGTLTLTILLSGF